MNRFTLGTNSLHHNLANLLIGIRLGTRVTLIRHLLTLQAAVQKAYDETNIGLFLKSITWIVKKRTAHDIFYLRLKSVFMFLF